MKRCKHCGEEIREINYALGPKWMHDPYPHRFNSMYWFCQKSVAEPAEPAESEE